MDIGCGADLCAVNIADIPGDEAVDAASRSALIVTRKKAQLRKPGSLAVRVQEMARREAKRQAQRVPWERLLQARTEYIEWEIFGFWARLIVEAEGDTPDWLRRTLETRCPGFLEEERRHRETHPGRNSSFSSLLSNWVEYNIFRDAREQGWMLAITFYAVRDFHYHRAWSYWQRCDEQWKQRPPVSYPSFEEWRQSADNWEAEPPPGASVRKAYEAHKRVSPERLAEAVARFVDWEAFAYWVRSALESDREIPDVVVDELRIRCPGFLEYDEDLRKAGLHGRPPTWNRLLLWGEDYFFGEAKKEGWLDAIILYARRHPRDVRMVEYWVNWCDRWRESTQASYPAFEGWRQAADDYVVDPLPNEEW